MSLFKLVTLLVKLTHTLAQREEAKAKLRQVKFRRARALLGKQLQAEAEAARAKADALASRAATAKAEATIGSNAINEDERVAATLRGQLDYIVAKR